MAVHQENFQNFVIFDYHPGEMVWNMEKWQASNHLPVLLPGNSAALHKLEREVLLWGNVEMVHFCVNDAVEIFIQKNLETHFQKMKKYLEICWGNLVSSEKWEHCFYFTWTFKKKFIDMYYVIDVHISVETAGLNDIYFLWVLTVYHWLLTRSADGLFTLTEEDSDSNPIPVLGSWESESDFVQGEKFCILQCNHLVLSLNWNPDPAM